MERDPHKLDTITIDGWTTCLDETRFRLYLDHPPPRPYGLLDQLAIDARAWPVLLFWAVGLGLIAAAFFTHWAVAVLGAFVLRLYSVMLWSTAHQIRDSPLLTGVIKVLKPHRTSRSHSLSRVTMPDRIAYPLSLATLMAAPLIERDGRCEALFVLNPGMEKPTGYVLAVRPAPAEAVEQPEEGEAPASSAEVPQAKPRQSWAQFVAGAVLIGTIIILLFEFQRYLSGPRPPAQPPPQQKDGAAK